MGDRASVHHPQRGAAEHPRLRRELGAGEAVVNDLAGRRRGSGRAAATAIHAARAGLEVTVVERRPGPIDKACWKG